VLPEIYVVGRPVYGEGRGEEDVLAGRSVDDR